MKSSQQLNEITTENEITIQSNKERNQYKAIKKEINPKKYRNKMKKDK